MKNILAWVKSNVLVVVFSLLIIICLPAAFIGSSMWRDKIINERRADAEKKYGEVQALNVSYTLPSYEPGKEGVTVKHAANTQLTTWFKTERDRLQQASATIVKRALDFNQGVGPDAAAVGRSPYRPLVDGLFPSAGNKSQEMAKLNEMEEALLGKRNWPNPYTQLLESVRAGEPADPIRLAESLIDFSTRETEKITAGKRSLTAEEQAELTKQLAERRLGEYQNAAKNISVYATMDSLPVNRGVSVIPVGRIEPDLIEINQFFKYQWDYWVLSDFLAAVKLANTDSSGRSTNIEQSVVKRIDSIALFPANGLGRRDSSEPMLDPMTGMPMDTSAAAPAGGLAPINPAISLTGRESTPANTMYDVRNIEVSVVASSARLSEFLDAITRTNFMTVLDMDLTAVDKIADLKLGYYYGTEHVVRATLTIETVWLRNWMQPLMPKDIQAALKVPGVEGDPNAALGSAPSSETPMNSRGGGGEVGGKGGSRGGGG